MTDQSPEDWLPPGWMVEVRVRKNGKKDKYYFAPSSGLKFNSRAEVSRYLNTREVCHLKPEKKIKDTLKRSAKNVVVEKAIAEDLPPGWIKEIRVSKKGHKIRRDMLYTDPVSGYVFRSMKDVSRYLETGDLGRLAYKPKDKGSFDVELEDDNNSSPDVEEKQKLALSITRNQIICDQSPKFDEMVTDEQIIKSVCTEKCVPRSEYCSRQAGTVETDLSSSNLLESKGLEQIDGKSDSAESMHVSGPPARFLLANQSSNSEGTVQESENTRLGRRKYKNRKEYNLPRRASKRLAGLDIDPTPELKTSRVRRVVVKQSDDAGASTPPCSSPGSLAHWPSQQPSPIEVGLESESKFDSSQSTRVEHTGKIRRANKDEQKQDSSAVLPMGTASTSVEHAGRVEKGEEDNEKLDIPIDLPSMDLWSDPCIQFAIKTLTGVGIESPKSTKLSFVSTKIQHAIGDLATSATPEQNKMVEMRSNSDRKQGCTVVLPSQNLAIPEQRARKVEDKLKDNEKPGSPLNIDFCDSWMDPCIEFAIKTLTGAIPVDCVLDMQESFQSQQSSSQTQVSSGLTSANAGFSNSCQADFLCQQFDSLEKPNYRQQALVDPVTGRVSLQNSGTTVLHQHSEGRGNRCQ